MAWYQKTKQAMLTGTAVDLTADTVKCLLVDTNQQAVDTSVTGHEFLSDILAAARVATTVALTGVVVSGGNIDAADTPLPDVGGGKVGRALVLFLDTGTETTSRLLFTPASATGLPITEDGTADTIVWSANGLADL